MASVSNINYTKRSISITWNLNYFLPPMSLIWFKAGPAMLKPTQPRAASSGKARRPARLSPAARLMASVAALADPVSRKGDAMDRTAAALAMSFTYIIIQHDDGTSDTTVRF